MGLYAAAIRAVCDRLTRRQRTQLNQSPARALLCGLIRLYQLLISPLLPPSCRFHPSCSTYAVQAITRYGSWRGLWLTGWRLLRCHPFHPGGWDPVQ